MGNSTKIIWVRGAFGGSVHDLTIARRELIFHLSPNERILADKAYIGEPNHFICPYKPPKTQSQLEFNSCQHKHRAIVERMNRRIKIFHCLTTPWRHDLTLHEIVFFVCCQITNLSLCYEPL